MVLHRLSDRQKIFSRKKRNKNYKSNFKRSKCFKKINIFKFNYLFKKNQDRGYPDLSFFEIGPTFSGNKPGEQQVILGGLKSGVINRRSWESKARNIDVFDVKADVIKTLIELGIDENDMHISNKTQDYYNPGRSGSVNLKSLNGQQLASFGEIHPGIVSKLDLKEQNICGFEIYLKNIPEPQKKYRLMKRNYSVSGYQKSERDFAFVIDKNFKAGDIEKIISEVDLSLIKKVLIFDVFEGGNMPEGKKSIAVNVTIQSMNKTLSEKDLSEVSQKIINIVKTKTGGTIRS